jgi:hypothetical protein
MTAKESLRKAAVPALVAAAFTGGFLVHIFYQKWNPPPPVAVAPVSAVASASAPDAPAPEPAAVEAREVDKIKALAGAQAKVRGRVYRVGKSSKSNTYFINFGPSRAAFTAVIFASAVERFEQSKLAPKSFEGKEIEVTGEVKDDPRYGLEMILEDPAQVKILAD